VAARARIEAVAHAIIGNHQQSSAIISNHGIINNH
jgi:hypothetical protein